MCARRSFPGSVSKLEFGSENMFSGPKPVNTNFKSIKGLSIGLIVTQLLKKNTNESGLTAMSFEVLNSLI